MHGNVKIISVNNFNSELCASAARISTTQGTADEIFANAIGNEKNDALTKKVLSLGHKSFLEHATFSLAFSNVSVYVEQFFIDFRLASFTIKSRRYVDFSNMGYYIPEGLSGSARALYTEHVDSLFKLYGALLNLEIPKEDARFVLPYCFYSNFYCTLNARELVHILNEIRNGRGSGIPELTDIHDQICAQLKEAFPVILSELEMDTAKAAIKAGSAAEGALDIVTSDVRLIGLTEDIGVVSGIPDDIDLKEKAERRLEFVNAAFVIRNISLSGLTHLARHRMQSLMTQSLFSVDKRKFIMPATIKDNDEVYGIYTAAFDRNVTAAYELSNMGCPYTYYLNLSGNVVDAATNMNARELKLFFGLRCCSRAQWEIRAIADAMLRALREREPGFFANMGPNCFPKGECPEGVMSCGRMLEMQEIYGRK